MVYHDVLPYHGSRTIDKLRRRAQNHAMNEALRSCDLGVFTVPISKIPWIGKKHTRAIFIPVGANLPEPEKAWTIERAETNRPPTIAIFGITGGESGIWEIASISEALQIVAERLGKLRLVVMGRHTDTAEKALKNLMDKQPVEICALGLLPGEEIVRQMASSDVLLFVRGGISSRRGSAIAGIACGLPVVALEGSETASPITEAGVVLADPKRQRGLGEALLKSAFRCGISRRACGTEPARAGKILFVEGDSGTVCGGVAFGERKPKLRFQISHLVLNGTKRRSDFPSFFQPARPED